VISTGNAGCFRKSFAMVFKYYCVASVTKTFALKGVQTIHRSTPRTSYHENYPLPDIKVIEDKMGGPVALKIKMTRKDNIKTDV
jgi:hypothetical protein